MMALTCPVRWDFAYGGHLTPDGSTLREKARAPILSDGRAWGAAVAAWHGHERSSGQLEVYDHWEEGQAKWAAHQALRDSYKRDVIAQVTAGVVVDQEGIADRLDRLHTMLDHYMATSERLPNLTRLEDEIDVPIPSRSGSGRASSTYRFGWIH